jgi:Zn-dependent protease
LDYTAVAIGLGVVLLSLTVHEAAHAWTADRLGDPTARLLGRVSLNPLVHIDLLGTVILPVIAVVSGLPVIGWAKPVPVNTSRLGSPRRDFMLVAAAGPGSNVLIAIVAAVVLRALLGAEAGPVAQLALTTIQINVLLAVFNMVPVPPLDGGNVLAGLLPEPAAQLFAMLRPFGFVVLYALMFTGMLSAIIIPPAIFLMRLLVP